MKDKKYRKNLDNNQIAVSPIFHDREFVYDDKLVFVLMPFGEPWSDRIWEAIQRIIKGQGLRAERADNRHGPVVTEDIWRGIIEARIILADVTGWNPNVFYELGISHTVGQDVILITQPSGRLPFDTQGYRHIIYSDNPAGIKLLESEIPLKVEHYLTRKQVQKPVENGNRPPSKKEIENSWNAITNNWEPILPSMETKDLRSTAGALKKRMKQYVYVLSESESKELVLEIKKQWPDDMDKKKNIEDVHLIIENITTILNEWRNRYSTKLSK
ncbi:MAG: hypothetical protein VB022_10425 [Rikenellaceae bacterium]|nr:hypothetical protein [Rikenellaceae bacterium]